MINFLKEGRYFYQVNDNKIEEIEVKNATYLNGEVWYNDCNEQYDLSKVLKKTDNGFEVLRDLYWEGVNYIYKGVFSYSLDGHLNLFINDEGEVKKLKFFVYRYDLTNRKLISLYYKTEGDEKVIVDADKVFTTYNLAKESRDFEVINLDGTKETREGLISMIKLNDEQRKMVATLKGLLMDMKGMGIQIVADYSHQEMRFINARGISVLSGYLHDIPDDECYIPLDLLEGVGSSFVCINEDCEDVLVVKRKKPC